MGFTACPLGGRLTINGHVVSSHFPVTVRLHLREITTETLDEVRLFLQDHTLPKVMTASFVAVCLYLNLHLDQFWTT
jgi:hypothetical protein